MWWLNMVCFVFAASIVGDNVCNRYPQSQFPVDYCINCLETSTCQFNSSRPKDGCTINAGQRNARMRALSRITSQNHGIKVISPSLRFSARTKPQYAFIDSGHIYYSQMQCKLDCGLFINNKVSMRDCVSCTRESSDCVYVHESRTCILRQRARGLGLKHVTDYFKFIEDCENDCGVRINPRANAQMNCVECTKNPSCLFIQLDNDWQCIRRGSPTNLQGQHYNSREQCFDDCTLSHQDDANRIFNCLACTALRKLNGTCVYKFSPDPVCIQESKATSSGLHKGMDYASKPIECGTVCAGPDYSARRVSHWTPGVHSYRTYELEDYCGASKYHCQRLARQGYCQAKRRWMDENCKDSCNRCPTSFEESRCTSKYFIILADHGTHFPYHRFVSLSDSINRFIQRIVQYQNAVSLVSFSPNVEWHVWKDWTFPVDRRSVSSWHLPSRYNSTFEIHKAIRLANQYIEARDPFFQPILLVFIYKFPNEEETMLTRKEIQAAKLKGAKYCLCVFTGTHWNTTSEKLSSIFGSENAETPCIFTTESFPISERDELKYLYNPYNQCILQMIKRVC